MRDFLDERYGKMPESEERLQSKDFTCFTCQKPIIRKRQMILLTLRYYCNYECCQATPYDIWENMRQRMCQSQTRNWKKKQRLKEQVHG